MLQNVKSQLGRPFPEHEDHRGYIASIACISLFVFLFLYVLQPFDLDELGGSTFLYAVAFGAITFLVSLNYQFLIKKILGLQRTGQRHTFGYWIADVMVLILLIAMANYLFMAWIAEMSYQYWWDMLIATIIVSIFPIVFIGAISMARSEKKNQSVASRLNDTKSPMPSDTEIPKAIEGISYQNILYIESLQNYVRIHHTTDNKPQVITVRRTLSSLAAELKDSSLARCHRSYIVNTRMIISAAGNAQGLQLTLHHTSDVVPVSRSYVDAFRA